MNRRNYLNAFFQKIYPLMIEVNRLIRRRTCGSFSLRPVENPIAVQKIFVINLDRQVPRWKEMQRELESLFDRSQEPLTKLTDRFSAIDARSFEMGVDNSLIQPKYTLADQLFVEPNPILSNEYANDDQPVYMTRQEIAVALSHIEVWKQVALGDADYVLILEDDIFFYWNFSSFMEKAWIELASSRIDENVFDVLYLSYDEVKTKAEKIEVSDLLFKPVRGLWCLSGYVLSKKGAKKLLSLLPVRGPVDLWINFHFDKLDVYATKKPIINQRRDYCSDNLYSILPVLSKIGVLNDESPSIFPAKQLPRPIFAFGEDGTGLTSLAMALSMLGYRCCSDSNELPEKELFDLLNNKKRIFDAYVNIGSLSNRYIELAGVYQEAKFIVTVDDDEFCAKLDKVGSDEKMDDKQGDYEGNNRVEGLTELILKLKRMSKSILVLSAREKNKWKKVCNFLGCDPPNGEYPGGIDKGQRHLLNQSNGKYRQQILCMNSDMSPWITPFQRHWHGLSFKKNLFFSKNELNFEHEDFNKFDESRWELLNDTFPGNLSIFDPKNFSLTNDKMARLNLRKEASGVREYKSSSFKSCNGYLYGCFSTVIRPSNVSGTITGVFLHRNSPRQEIDIEFLGKDSTKMLVNVFYNPGENGAKFDYGYKGTPVIIDLGFDASKEFHQYSIEWTDTFIRWHVDGLLVHERVSWNPTPIPHLPMQFYINLWPCRSKELAGRLDDGDLPAYTEIRSITLRTWSFIF
jgi:GR25 family glycosyltransferase involved in LPS biosynthesis